MDNQTCTDEITLRELIESLWRGKYVIIVLTILGILLSGVFSFFVLPKEYEAKTVLMANPIDLNGANLGSGSNELVEYLTKLPTMTIETYLQQILAPEVLNETIEQLDLRNAEGNLISHNSLRGAITVTRIKDTNLLEVLVERGDPEQAARVADSVADSFIQYITLNTQRMGQQSVTLIENQLAIEEANLNEKARALADYWKENDNIDVLKGSVSALKNQLVKAKEDLLVLDRSIEADKDSLTALVSAAGDTVDFDLDAFWLTIGLTDENEEDEVEQSNPDLNLNLSGDNLSQALLHVSISEIQTRLVEQTSQRAALSEQIGTIETDLTEEQIQLTEDEYRFNALNRDMEMAKQAYDAYQQKYKEVMLTAASDIGKSSVIITSHATVPTGASSPNTMLNLAIGAVLGLMLGVFLALFVDYWKRSKPETKKA